MSVTSNLPDGRILTRETLDELQEKLENDGVLTEAEKVEVLGADLPAPTIKRSFPTGDHPAARRYPFGTGRFP